MTDYSVLARSYSTLDYENKLRRTLISFYQTETLDRMPKAQLHRIINDILLKHYNGEEILKYHIAKYFLKRDYVAAFEVNVINSRADFLAINGNTKCFEIKSKIDTLKRLDKQIHTYKDVFEFNTVIVDEKHIDSVRKLLPDYYGIWMFKGNKLFVFKNASISPELNPRIQLDMFTKKELTRHFGINDRNIIHKEFNGQTINTILKITLKERYITRWNFVKNNWIRILPMDLQFFFNSNIDPDLIYKT